MRMVAAVAVLSLGVVAAPARAQAPAEDAGTRWRILNELRAAMAPALPYPLSDADGAEPADGASTAPWMVRPLDRDTPFIEVIANPLNPDQQARASKAMAEIGAAIDTVQRKSQAQYERAVEEARRTGRSQDVDGVTLADEGVPGARIDAESHVVAEVILIPQRYVAPTAGSMIPRAGEVVVPGAAGVVTVAPHVFRDRTDSAAAERFIQAEALVFFGTAAPEVRKTGAFAFEVTAAAPAAEGARPGVHALVVRLRGNNMLIADIVRNSDWARVSALLEP
jgi:hypothetical protein